MWVGSRDRRVARGALRLLLITLVAVVVGTWSGWTTPAHAAGPDALDDAVSAVEDVPTTGNVLTNDDDGGAAVSAHLWRAPVNGTIVLNADGSFTYTPNANFHGTDTFVYRAVDETDAFDEATVTITIAAVNDAPTAIPEDYSMYGDSAFVVSAQSGVLSNDADGDALTARLVTTTTHGTLSLNPDGSFSYTPDPGYVGDDGFTYAAEDGDGASDIASVRLVVFPEPSTNQPPTATDGAVTTEQDTATAVDVSTLTSDSDGDALGYTTAAAPAHGTITLAGAVFTYTPDTGFVGTDSFDYTATDPDGAAATGTITITITAATAPPSPDDDPPVEATTPGDATTPIASDSAPAASALPDTGAPSDVALLAVALALLAGGVVLVRQGASRRTR